MTTAHLCITLAILVYLGCMLYVGYRCSKNNNDSADFYLGGRKLGLVTAMSAEASDMSSWLLMGLPGLAYLTGVADAGWTAIGLAIGTYLNWRIVAKRIRRYTHVAGNSITLPSFFSNRYRDEKKFFQPVRDQLSGCHGHQCIDHRRLYNTWRIPCRIHHRFYPEHHYVDRTGYCIYLWY